MRRLDAPNLPSGEVRTAVPPGFAVAHFVVVVLAIVQNGELRRVTIIDDQGAVPATHGIGLVGVHMAGISVVFLW